jgi:hypothetical protein
MALPRVAVRGERATRHLNLYRDGEKLAFLVTPMRRFDDDPAAGHAVMVLLEFLGPLSDAFANKR